MSTSTLDKPLRRLKLSKEILQALDEEPQHVTMETGTFSGNTTACGGTNCTNTCISGQCTAAGCGCFSHVTC